MKPSLDDLALFLAVADAGGLTGAARATGVSRPTLSRRMTALETQLGTRLFQRGAKGYTLTSRGRALLETADPLRSLSADVARLIEADPTPRVRITAGTWTARFLARHAARLTSDKAPWLPEFVSASERLDIARREADIGIRNARPEQPWLSARRTARITYAIFAASPDTRGLIAPPEALARVPSAAWVWRTRAAEVSTTVTDPRLALDLARTGRGALVLPRFVGADEPALIQIGPPIAELAHDEWLVAHQDTRHDPPIRAALDAIGALLTDRELRV